LTQPGERDQSIAMLRDRLSKLTEASLRINESLDVDAALQGVMDGARSVARAPYAVITTLDASGQVEEFLALGIESSDADRIWQAPEGLRLFEYLNSITRPLRLGNLEEFAKSIGLQEFRMPIKLTAFMAAPILLRGARVGNLYVGSDEPGRRFTQDDEESLVMFASQAARVISNARIHRDEKRARIELETLVNTAPVGVVVFDARTGAPVSINREAMRIVDGLRDGDQRPEDLLELVTFERADGREVSLRELPVAQALQSGETVRAEEVALRVPDGRSVTVLLNATPIRSENDAVVSMVVTLQDLTPLDELERLRAEFLGIVSHELRLPLTSISGSATAMLDDTSDLDPAELRQFLRIILDQAASMRDLIGDLLDVARIETGTLPINLEPADVPTLVDRARSMFVSAGGGDNLGIDLAPDLPLVMADKRRIVQVISNLLSNAARHSPESSVVKVAAAPEGGYVEISVSDEGRGIPSERLPYLFRKFAPGAADDRGDDTGLGLAICKGIVEAHGGRIWAESDGPGLGTRFAFTVPVVEEEPAERHRPPPSARRVAQKGELILAVDDDPQMLRFIRRALSQAGYEALVTGDPDEVLALVEETGPDLILLDLMLPRTDGKELMRDILAVTEAPVIFISAYGRDQVVAEVLDSGAADYIVKPFSPTELAARVRAALRRRAGSHQFEPVEPYVLSDLTIDYAQRVVSLAGRQIQLTATEYRLLFELSVNAGRVLTHDQLLRRVWGPRKSGDIRALRTHLRRLRQKLGEDGNNPTWIFAEPRVGYRMPKAEGSDNAPPESGG